MCFGTAALTGYLWVYLVLYLFGYVYCCDCIFWFGLVVFGFSGWCFDLLVSVCECVIDWLHLLVFFGL